MAFQTPNGQLLYRVGDIIITINNENPSKIYGGTWQLLCPGKTLVCVDTSDNDFSVVKKTGGTKTHALSIDEMPSHTHTQNAHNHGASIGSGGAHTHNIYTKNIYMAKSTTTYWNLLRPTNGDAPNGTNAAAMSAGAHTHSVTVNNATISNQNTGGSKAHNNLQPYMSVYMWVRTA